MATTKPFELEKTHPVLGIALQKKLIEQGQQGAGIPEPGRPVDEARVFGEVRPPDGFGKDRPKPRVLGDTDREQEPAIVAAAVVVGERIERFAARRPWDEAGSVEAGLDEAGIGPSAVRHQRTADLGAFAGALALEQRGDDRAIKGERRRMVAHAGHGSRRQALRVRAHLVHQAGARPPGRGVKARLVRLGAVFAIGGERRIDQALVEMRKLVEGDAEAAPDRRRMVGDEHVGAEDEIVDDLPRLRTFEIERQAALVAGVDRPAIVLLAHRHAGLKGKVAEGIAGAGGLDLDHLRAEIGHDGCCCGRRNEARRIEHLEPGENAWLAHAKVPP